MRAAAGTHRALNQDEATTIELLEAVLASDNLARAWKRVKANKGAPGIDGVTVQDWPAHARAHWPALREQTEQGRYRPQAVRRVEIPTPDGGKRMLGIPTVTDRVVQQAIAQVLTPIFDPSFSESSFGFRPGRNAHQAIRQVQAFVTDGRRIAVDIPSAASARPASRRDPGPPLFDSHRKRLCRLGAPLRPVPRQASPARHGCA